MIKLTIYASRLPFVTENVWDYLKAIGDHIASNRKCTSFLEYAIYFNALSKNIELERALAVQYQDTVIKLYSLSDWEQRTAKVPYPIAAIEINQSTY